MQLHFFSFLLNIASWVIFGILIGRGILSLQYPTGSVIRFYFTMLVSALIGGLLAQLANGTPEFGISLINLLVSGFAVIVSVFLAFPLYAKALMRKIKNTTLGSIRTIRFGMHILRNK